MTDQNYAYRHDNDTSADEDPLAELARIVAGEPAPVRKTAAPVPVYAQSIELESDLDIEAELMRELWETEPGKLIAQEANGSASGFDTSRRDTTEPAVSLARSLATPLASPAAKAEELSLEEQLMAELSGEVTDDYSADQFARASIDDMPRYDTPQLDRTISSEFSAYGEREQIVDPADTVEEIAAGFRSELESTIDHAAYSNGHVDHVSGEVMRDFGAEAAVEADDLDDFFADGFSELLNEKADTQVSQVRKSLATPQIPVTNEFETAPKPQFDDIELDFAEAFAEELAHVEPKAVPVETGIEDDFARIFEEQMQRNEPAFDSRVESGMAALAPQRIGYPAPISDPAPDFIDFEDDTLASVPLAPVPSRNGFKLAVGALSLALVVGLGVVAWGAFSGIPGTTEGEPAIVKADSEPIKIKPEEPGGKVIANQDNQVYNKVAGTQSEDTVQEELISSREQVSEDAKATNRLAPREDTAPQQATLGISPKKVRTLTVKPDGTIIQAEPEVPAVAVGQVAAVTPSALSEPVTSELALDAPATAPAEEETVSLASIDGAVSTGNPAIPTPSPLPAPEPQVEVVKKAVAPKPVANATPEPVAVEPVASTASDPNAPTQIANLNSAPVPTPTVSSSEWKVQVSSQRSRDAAEASFNNIQGRFGSLLSGRSANIERADVDGKGTFYRVKILADSKSAATDLCTRLKSAGGSCFVTR